MLFLSACLSGLHVQLIFFNWTHPLSNLQSLFSDSSHVKDIFDYWKFIKQDLRPELNLINFFVSTVNKPLLILGVRDSRLSPHKHTLAAVVTPCNSSEFKFGKISVFVSAENTIFLKLIFLDYSSSVRKINHKGSCADKSAKLRQLSPTSLSTWSITAIALMKKAKLAQACQW